MKKMTIFMANEKCNFMYIIILTITCVSYDHYVKVDNSHVCNYGTKLRMVRYYHFNVI